jgi:hypothetical protein
MKEAYTTFWGEWKNAYMTDWTFGGRRLLTRHHK